MTSDPRVQLRLRYDLPSASQRLRLSLRGLQVTVHPDDGDLQRAGAYLQGIGAGFTVDDRMGVLLVGVRDLHLLLSLPHRVVLVTDEVTATLLRVLRAATDPAMRIVCTLDSPHTANLNWVDETGECNEAFPLTDVSALLTTGVPLSASPQAWQEIERASHFPVVRARARVNLDGFIEIATPFVQQVADLELPALFHLDEHRFGLPLGSGAHLQRIPGLVWEGPHPVWDSTPSPRRERRLVLGQETEHALVTLIERTHIARGQVLAWPSGLGRRVFALSAALTLDAFPLLVICREASLWAWHRHRDLLIPADVDVQVVSYGQLEQVGLLTPSCIVFDDPFPSLTDDPRTRHLLRRLDGSVDCLRLACLRSIPADATSQMRLMSLVRPVEFTIDVPPEARYPQPHRLREHVDMYVLSPPSAQSAFPFKRSKVEIVAPPSSLARRFEELALIAQDRPRARRERVEMLLEWLSSGPDEIVNPKIARAVELAVMASRRGETTMIVTRSRRSLSLLTGLLAGVTGPPIGVVLDDGALSAPLADVENLIALEPPLSWETFDRAVGHASAPGGVRSVTVLHLDNDFEDRLVVIAATRFTGRVETGTPLSTQEIDFVLGGYRAGNNARR